MDESNLSPFDRSFADGQCILPKGLSASAKAYMKAIRSSVMSLYEESDIVPGQSFLARDLIRGGEPVRVSEHSATTQMKPWDRVGARIVPLSGTYLCGGVMLVYDRGISEQDRHAKYLGGTHRGAFLGIGRPASRLQSVP
jgi:hypothetical protein